MRTARQAKLYTHTCSLYRTATPVDSATGKPGATTIELAYENVPCYYEYTPNVDDATPVSRIKRMTLITTDIIHFYADQEVKNGWWAKNTTPNNPNAGAVHKLLGAAQGLPGAGRRTVNKQQIMAMQEEHSPVGIS